MQKVRLLCVGKLKDSWLRDGCYEYSKRLGGLCQFEQIEVADEPLPTKLNATIQEQILYREGERLVRVLTRGDYVIALTLKGKMLDSEGLALKLSDLALNGNSSVAFIIGGSLGLGSNILSLTQEELCLSQLTFPHQLCRLILMEQIYRAFSIQNGMAYHK